jgi:hypothetical protein
MGKEEEQKQRASGLNEIRSILKEQFKIFSQTSEVLKETSEGFNKIDNTYEHYESAIDKSKEEIRKLKRREFYENLFIYIGFCFFFLCVAIVMLRRFPLHKIIYLVYSLLEYIIFKIMDLKNVVISNHYHNHTNYTNYTYDEVSLPEIIIKNFSNITMPNSEL